MRQHKVKETPPNPKSFTNRFRRMRGSEKRHIDYMKCLYTAALLFTFLACSVQPVMAANVWDKAKEIIKDVYNQIVLISTIAAVVTAAVPKDAVLREESRAVVERTFEGSLPSFLAHFMGGKTISDDEADALKAIIDQYREGNHHA